MAKLHEVLAVEGNLKNQTDAVRKELMQTFDKKRHHFTRKLVTFKSNQENVPPVTEEQLDLQSTIGAELKWITNIWKNSLDASYQVAEANTKARADVILDDGSIILKDVPATALLELEKRVQELHDFVNAIPTLDPAKGFQLAPNEGAGVYVAREEVRTRTKKTVSVLVKYPATDKHPAQTELVNEDVPVGTVHNQEWSGLITVTEKGLMLERAENLRRAVKKARARANEQSVEPVGFGEKLLKFVFGV